MKILPTKILGKMFDVGEEVEPVAHPLLYAVEHASEVGFRSVVGVEHFRARRCFVEEERERRPLASLIRLRMFLRIFLARLHFQVGEVSLVHRENPIEGVEVVVLEPARSDRIAGYVALGEEFARAPIDLLAHMELLQPAGVAEGEVLRISCSHDSLGARRAADVAATDEKHGDGHMIWFTMLLAMLLEPARLALELCGRARLQAATSSSSSALSSSSSSSLSSRVSQLYLRDIGDAR